MTGGSGVRVLAVVDGTSEFTASALAAGGLFSKTPCAQFTVLAPADVASPEPTPGTLSGGLVSVSRATTALMALVREIEALGFPTRLRTTEGSLLAKAAKIAGAHDLVVLPPSLARFAADFDVPVLVAPMTSDTYPSL